MYILYFFVIKQRMNRDGSEAIPMHKKLYRKILICLLALNIAAIGCMGYYILETEVPNEIKIMVGREEQFDFSLPFIASLFTEDIDVFNVNNKVVTTNQVNINFNQPFTILSGQTGSYSLDLTLFGVLKFKEIRLDVIDTVELIPSGEPIGIYVKTNGVMVLGTSVITSMDGMNCEPALNKLKSGDYITAINGKQLSNKRDLIQSIQSSGGDPVILTVRREKETFQVAVTPVETAMGEYKIGTWIRDDTQGIGTLTFVTTDKQFGALGHGITDVDTSLLMEVSNGDVYTAEIMSIVKGKNGAPGELIGLINQSDKFRVGTIDKNTNQGIFGDVDGKSQITSYRQSVPVGLKQEVELGDAVIRCNVDGTVRDYTIQIEKVDRSNSQLSKGMIIKITDERLLTLTGGIVQGMSGSPIIQNDKIIGAVTHVFIQDSTKGYGTFIENMIRNLDE